jgi:hypothetical protein
MVVVMTKDEALRLALEALEKLWNIIDDIDTYSDMAKADEKLYRSLVERRQRQRFEETGISTDGYELHGGAITAIKAALEAKDEIDWKDMYEKEKRRSEMWVAKYERDIGPLEKAVPQQEAKDEPVAWMRQDGQRVTTASDRHNYPDYETRYSIPLYATPSQRTWVGLTDEHKEGLICMTDPNPEPHHLRELIDVVEFQLKEKNT